MTTNLLQRLEKLLPPPSESEIDDYHKSGDAISRNRFRSEIITLLPQIVEMVSTSTLEALREELSKRDRIYRDTPWFERAWTGEGNSIDDVIDLIDSHIARYQQPKVNE
jgi:hypothetical protein